MIVFICSVLVIATLQSFFKLTLLPRKWTLFVALLLGVLPFFFVSRLSQASMSDLNLILTSKTTLTNWCTLVVVQELFMLVMGFSLLAEYESGLKIRKWKFLSFLPSFLVPLAVLYLQMFMFNQFPDYTFKQLTWALAILLPVGLLIITELFRWVNSDSEGRVLAVFNMEYLLLLPAIFLPVASTAELAVLPLEFAVIDSAITVGGIVVIVVFSGVITQVIRKYRRRKNV